MKRPNFDILDENHDVTAYERHYTSSLLSTGPGRSWIAGPAGISRLGPNSEPRGNNRSFPETRERDRVPVKKIGSRDSIFGLVNSTYSFEITNHNQLVSNIKYLANFIKKYWTYFRYQKLADFLVCLPPSVRVRRVTIATSQLQHTATSELHARNRLRATCGSNSEYVV